MGHAAEIGGGAAIKASELILNLQALMLRHAPDFEVKVDTGEELEAIEEVDVDYEEEVIVIWMR